VHFRPPYSAILTCTRIRIVVRKEAVITRESATILEIFCGRRIVWRAYSGYHTMLYLAIRTSDSGGRI